MTGCRVGLVGLPDDTGVTLNGGRAGAAVGPSAFRAALARYGVANPIGWTYPKVFDAGDVAPVAGGSAEALRATHDRVRAAVRGVLDLGLFPIAVGGGHDLTLAFAGAVIEWHRERATGGSEDEDGDGDERGGEPEWGCVYCDAHLDVRQQVGSGMPFRGLIERHGVRPLLVEGLDDMANARELVEWFEDHGGEVGEPDEPAEDRYQEVFADTRHIVASFDMDALDMGVAPGVSAMNPCGMSVRDAEGHVRRWGADPRVVCFDIMELNPAHDEGGRTARAAARLFLAFLAAFSQRPASGLGE